MRKLVLTVLAASLVGCAGPAETPADSAAASVATAEHVAVPLTELQEQGRTIYQTVCWTCHGTAGRGDGPTVAAGSTAPPPTFHTQDYSMASVDRLERQFRVGMDQADAGHPHMQYVATLLEAESFTAALAFIPALAYPVEIPGSALAGQELYAFRCAGCHGDGGHGDGPGAELLVDVRPQDFAADTLIAAQDWDGLYARVREGGRSVHGSSMPPWGIVLDEGQMWDLVAYLATFQEGSVAPPPWS